MPKGQQPWPRWIGAGSFVALVSAQLSPRRWGRGRASPRLCGMKRSPPFCGVRAEVTTRAIAFSVSFDCVDGTNGEAGSPNSVSLI